MTVERLPPLAPDAPLLSAEDVGAFHLPPDPLPPGIVYETDAVYGHTGPGGRELVAHVLRPAERVPHGRPAVVFVHGGAWAGGHPFMHIRMAAALAEAGYVTACIHYRLSGEAPWPAALEDAKCAVRWMRASAAALGVDPDRIGVAGGSAGAHLAALVAFTPGRFEGDGGHDGVPSHVAAAVLLYPPTDLRLPHNDPVESAELHHHVDAFRGTAPHEELDPVLAITPSAPPVLTLTGDADQAIPLAGVERLHATLDAAGVPNHLVVYQGRNHAFDFQPVDWVDTADRFRAWFDRWLQPAATSSARPATSPEANVKGSRE